MSRAPRLPLRIALLLLTVLALPAVLSARRADGPDETSLESLELEYRKHRKVLSDLIYKPTERADAKNKAHNEALDFEARWITYRFAKYTFHKPSGPGVNLNKTIEGLYRDF